MLPAFRLPFQVPLIELTVITVSLAFVLGERLHYDMSISPTKSETVYRDSTRAILGPIGQPVDHLRKLSILA